ncbi:MAG: YcaQ family DNA glycosylase [Anaerolineae bacterium]|nr:YcaQ family DNA glycosylase [Anaerolineae bacterium]
MIRVIPLTAARTLALHTQGLAIPNKTVAVPDIEALYTAIEQIGCVQIDTLHVVHRAQYLTLWSRLGQYDPMDFDRLCADPEHRRLCEDWWHAASIIPLKNYRYTLLHKAKFREGGLDWEKGRWLPKPENRALMFDVLERVRNEGPLRAADFEGDGVKRGSWWNWKSAKTALEYLWARGDLMITRRVNFQKVYDLTERVMPEWVDQTPPTQEEIYRYRVETGVKALGICEPSQVAEYAYIKKGIAKPFVEEMIREGILAEVKAKAHSGRIVKMVVHRENMPQLEQIIDGTLRAERTTFINPFDNLLWAKERDQRLWGFHTRLEAYKPKSQRIWGYYCLSILHHDKLVGRFDPKLERKEGVLRLKALYLETGIEPEERLVTDVAATMQDFMAFHKAKELVIERSQPQEFGKKLLAAIMAV